MFLQLIPFHFIPYISNAFSLQIPDYAHSLDEDQVCENSFQIIFAFDEIVALGYRESVNLSQVRTYVKMDSHEEKVFRAVRETQEKEAKTKMKVCFLKRKKNTVTIIARRSALKYVAI